MDINF